MEFRCENCGQSWRPLKLASGADCDDTFCRLCSGKECPSCGHLQEEVTGAVKGLKNEVDIY